MLDLTQTRFRGRMTTDEMKRLVRLRLEVSIRAGRFKVFLRPCS